MLESQDEIIQAGTAATEQSESFPSLCWHLVWAMDGKF